QSLRFPSQRYHGLLDGTARADVKGGAVFRPVYLTRGNVEIRNRIFIDVEIFNVLHDADNRQPLSPAVDFPADGIASGNKPADKLLIHDHHRLYRSMRLVIL